MPEGPELSIVIPAYNEERRLAPTVRAWRGFLDAEGIAGEIVVSDDGSRDRTVEVANEAAEGDPRVRVITAERNQGKGGAVRSGMLEARGRFVFYVDADLNIDPAHVPGALALLRRDADLVVGRRDLREYAREERSPARIAAGAAVQVTRRLLMLTWVTDTQAGYKGFRRALAHEVFAAARIRSFAFDIEAIYLARRLGARIAEQRVSVEFRDESTYDLRRHLPAFLRDIWRIRLNAIRGRYPGRGRRRRP